MNTKSAANAYSTTSFESAPPLKIVRMMYAGAIRFIEQAEQVDIKSMPGDFCDKLSRAEAVVSELRVSLHSGHSPELSKNLTDLYLFVEGCIRESFLDMTKGALLPARKVLSTLLEGWSQVETSEPENLRATGS
jgi:flagellar protein FliS